MRIPRLFCLLLAMLPFALKAAQPPAPGAVPAPPDWLSALDALYDAKLHVPGLEQRNFAPERWWAAVAPLISGTRGFQVEQIGYSVQQRPLRHVSWGNGKTRVLLWSQMHGNESTGSMALADLFRFLGEHPDDPVVQALQANTTLHFLPILNPDGAARFQRTNVQGIDLNQDARALATPEARALKALHSRLRPDFGFNLHDQRVGYRAGDSERGTAIALLSPPYNEARDINEVRRRAIEVAGVVRIALEPYLASHIARWDDTFNPRAFGDLTTQWGTSTVLIEAGGIEGDAQKQRLRKLYFLALVSALDSIATGSHAGVPATLYTDLPQNGEVWPDLLVHGGTLAIPGKPAARADLLVNFQDPLTETGGSIARVGDLAEVRARRSIDASGLFVVPITRDKGSARSTPTLDPGAASYFHLSRDAQGHDIVWTLAGDVDAMHPGPEPASPDPVP